MWNSLPALRRIQWSALGLWIVGLAVFWLAPEGWRIAALIIWIVAMTTCFIAFFRAMWLAADAKKGP